MFVARQADDLVCLAGATRVCSRAMLDNGQGHDALSVLAGMIDRLRPHLRDADPALLSLYGMLLLRAEIAAAKVDDPVSARDMNRRAAAVAERLAVDRNDYGTAFGPTNVPLHRLAALVRLRDAASALDFAETIDSTAAARLPKERRVNYLLDVATANLHRARHDEATAAVTACRPHRPGGGAVPATEPQTRRRSAARDPAARDGVAATRCGRRADRVSTVYVVVCGAGPASRVGVLVDLAQDRGHRVCLVATGAAVPMLDVPGLASATGRAVRVDHQPGDRLPRADGMIVAPATYNTINKWAAGVADTYPLTLLAELTGAGVPIVVLPFVNAALAANTVFVRSMASLRDAGVRILSGPDGVEPHPAGTGSTRLGSYPWHLALDALARMLG